MTYRLGIDVGGTSTDVLLVEDAGGAAGRATTASTPSDRAGGALTGIAEVRQEAGIALSAVAPVPDGAAVRITLARPRFSRTIGGAA